MGNTVDGCTSCSKRDMHDQNSLNKIQSSRKHRKVKQY